MYNLNINIARDTGVLTFDHKGAMMIHLGHLLMSIVVLVFCVGKLSPLMRLWEMKFCHFYT